MVSFVCGHMLMHVGIHWWICGSAHACMHACMHAESAQVARNVLYTAAWHHAWVQASAAGRRALSMNRAAPQGGEGLVARLRAISRRLAPVVLEKARPLSELGEA